MVAILLTGIYLFGSTNACQLLKLPLLASHYLNHKQESPYITLYSFVKMHYIDDQPFDEDYAQGMQLPFKTTPDTFCVNTPSIVPVFYKMVLKVPAPYPQKQFIVKENILLNIGTSRIFQPPRI